MESEQKGEEKQKAAQNIKKEMVEELAEKRCFAESRHMISLSYAEKALQQVIFFK